VVRRLLLLLAAAGAAAAGSAQARPASDEPVRIAKDRRPTPPPPKPVTRKEPAGPRKIGFRFGGGAGPIDGQIMSMLGLALAAERPIAGRWQWIAEYEHLWLMPRQTANARLRGESSFDGNAHRLHLGLRATLASKRLGQLRFFADAEAGGGATLAAYHGDTDLGPHAFAGVRLGYELSASRGESRPKKTWEWDLALRTIAVQNGLGLLGGLAMYWGD
jgi:hypothetical protein